MPQKKTNDDLEPGQAPTPPGEILWWDRVRGFVYNRAKEKIRAKLASEEHYFASTGRLKQKAVAEETLDEETGAQLSRGQLSRILSGKGNDRPGQDALEALARWAGWAGSYAVEEWLRRHREPYPSTAFPPSEPRLKRTKGRKPKAQKGKRAT